MNEYHVLAVVRNADLDEGKCGRRCLNFPSLHVMLCIHGLFIPRVMWCANLMPTSAVFAHMLQRINFTTSGLYDLLL